MAPISSGSRSRSSIGALLGETRLQERFVRRILEQPAHQVGHARQHRAVGRVDPHAVAAVDQGALDQVAHAEEGLQLVGRLRQLAGLGGGDRVRQAADVVAAERRPQLLVVLDQEAGAALEATRRFATSGGRPARASPAAARSRPRSPSTPP